jgi:hypothetical protein
MNGYLVQRGRKIGSFGFTADIPFGSTTYQLPDSIKFSEPPVSSSEKKGRYWYYPTELLKSLSDLTE